MLENIPFRQQINSSLNKKISGKFKLHFLFTTYFHAEDDRIWGCAIFSVFFFYIFNTQLSRLDCVFFFRQILKSTEPKRFLAILPYHQCI